MRTKFVFTTKRRDAVAAMPWALKIASVSGGFGGFESLADYKAWTAARAKRISAYSKLIRTAKA